jgi:SAM-dependent methyltransferase
MLFDDRYRLVHEQGIPAWIPDQTMLSEAAHRLDQFLDTAEAVPGRTRVIETACGEGFLARHLLELGYDYLGLDISALALEKARSNASQFGKPDNFLLGDMTNMPQIASASFDISIDNFGLQMLVTDPDREKYLTELNRILKPGGWAYFHENDNEEGYWEELTQAGFEVVEFHTFSEPFPTCVIYARKEGGTESCENCKRKGESI